jgi:RimJ/RimL family protein N-acetyltransferase
MIVMPRPRPDRVALEGQYACLQPLVTAHAADLFSASTGPANRSRFDYLFEEQPDSPESLEKWADSVSRSNDPMYFAVLDKRSGRCEGRQALMNITPEQGVIELGSIYWGPTISRTRIATEAFYLHMKYIFDELGYRRFEWKCHNHNEPSKRAARRFGFSYEGLFRQHMVVKGQSRDTAWFSIVNTEWPGIRLAFENWLSSDNFDSKGHERQALQTAQE